MPVHLMAAVFQARRPLGPISAPPGMHALAANLVSFARVQRRPARTAVTATCRSRTVAAMPGRTAADLESVLAGKTATGYASHRAIRSHRDVLGPQSVRPAG